MNNRTILYLSGLVIVAIAALFFLNLTSVFDKQDTSRYLSANEVRGMALVHNNLPYTLNFDQQSKVIEILNEALPVAPKIYSRGLSNEDFEKLIIYRFDKPDLEIVPAGYDENELVFNSPEWNPHALMREYSNGELKKIISGSFDHVETAANP